MKKILFVAPHSFPIKSSEAICNSKVAYVLAKNGYSVDVFSCSDNSTYPSDTEYNEKLSNSANLHICTIEPKYIIRRNDNIFKILVSLVYNFWIWLTTGYFYNGISIPYLLYKKIRKYVEQSNIKYDAIITRGFHTDLVGILLAKRYGIKWIANWNDPYPNKRFPAPYGEGYDAKLPFFEERVMQDIQRYASLHTFPNDRLRNYMLKCFNNVSLENTFVIPHMALSTLYENRSLRKDRGRLKIVHCGYLKNPRNPELFIRALANVKSSYKYKDVDFVCHIVGSYEANVGQLVENLGLNENIELHSSLSYKESMDFISECDIALIIEAQCEEGIYLPTKVVDSIQCHLPLLCISPKDGVLHDMIKKYHVGYFADNTSIDEISKAIEMAFSDYLLNSLPLVDQHVVPEIFEDCILKQYQSIL